MSKYVFTAEQYKELSKLLKEVTQMLQDKYQGQHKDIIADLNNVFATAKKRVRVIAPASGIEGIIVKDAKLIECYEMDVKRRDDMVWSLGQIRYRQQPEFLYRLKRMHNLLKAAKLEIMDDVYTMAIIADANTHKR